MRPLFPRLRHEFNPTTRPITLLLRYKSPLVKVKVFARESSQPPERVLACVERLNPELGAIVGSDVSSKAALSQAPKPRNSGPGPGKTT